MKILNVLEDNSGGTSSSRAMMLMWGIGTLLVWSFLSVMIAIKPISSELVPDENNPQIVYIEKQTPKLPPIPETVLILILGLSAGKVVQRFGEKPIENDDSSGKQK